mmetsp:Transcript_8446/g.9870  ORF Transcript_8446/g.9870 Transcript_8446/m.9870 type:complete len:200 (+) Transcript_8446:151-750(+)
MITLWTSSPSAFSSSPGKTTRSILCEVAIGIIIVPTELGPSSSASKVVCLPTRGSSTLIFFFFSFASFSLSKSTMSKKSSSSSSPDESLSSDTTSFAFFRFLFWVAILSSRLIVRSAARNSIDSCLAAELLTISTAPSESSSDVASFTSSILSFSSLSESLATKSSSKLILVPFVEPLASMSIFPMPTPNARFRRAALR